MAEQQPEPVPSAPPKEKKKDKEKESAVDELKRGEYFLHVFIEDATALDITKDDAAEVVIKLTAFGETKYTRSSTNVTNDSSIYLGEHFFFVSIFDNRDALENETMTITVIRKRTLNSEEVGSMDINVSSVYFEQDHTIRHRWFILQNKKKNFQAVKGYLKMSMNLLTDTDPKVELGPETYDSNSENFKDLVDIPPSIVLKTSQIRIICIRGQNFPKLDTIGAGIDAYIRFTLGSIKVKTSISKSLNPYWNEEILLPLMEPSYLTQLKMEVCDHETLRKDEPVGSKTFELSKVKQGVFKSYQWIHLYGAPDGSNKDQRNMMFEYPSKGKSSVIFSILVQRISNYVA